MSTIMALDEVGPGAIARGNRYRQNHQRLESEMLEERNAFLRCSQWYTKTGSV